MLGSRPAAQQVTGRGCGGERQLAPRSSGGRDLAIDSGHSSSLGCFSISPSAPTRRTPAMLAEQILRGHFQAFYPGQVYGGAEFTFSRYSSRSAATLLYPPSRTNPVLRGRGSARMAGHPAPCPVEVACRSYGAVVFASPEVNIATSSIYQGRGLTLVCGLLCILFGLRLLDEPRSMQSTRV